MNFHFYVYTPSQGCPRMSQSSHRFLWCENEDSCTSINSYHLCFIDKHFKYCRYGLLQPYHQVPGLKDVDLQFKVSNQVADGPERQTVQICTQKPTVSHLFLTLDSPPMRGGGGTLKPQSCKNNQTARAVFIRGVRN